MRARGRVCLVGALVAAVVLVSGSGAATAKSQKGMRIDVSSRRTVIGYLRSMHIKAKGVVIQRAGHNYAGPHCPGKAWACASTRNTVVQIARRGGQNRFVCRSSTCVAVQLSGVSHGLYIAGRSLASPSAPGQSNAAACIETKGHHASCSITQSAAWGTSTAVVYENAGTSSGPAQADSYSASITQCAGTFERGGVCLANNSSASNVACVDQETNIDGSTTAKNDAPVSVALESHESVTVHQWAQSGGNSAQYSAKPTARSATCDTSDPLTQKQTLTSTASASGPIKQSENAANHGANVSLDIEQNQSDKSSGFFGSASGANNANFSQLNSLTAIADTSAGPVSQTQSSSSGGLSATVDQDSTGVEIASAKQTEIQCEDAATTTLPSCQSGADFSGPDALNQTQIGPVQLGAVTSSQTGGNTGDAFTIDQSSTQDDDQGSGSTQTNTVHSDCSTSGSCTSNQTTTVDGSATSAPESGQSVNSTISCTGSTCAAPPPPTPTITNHPASSSDSPSASFSFEDADPTVTFECQIDGLGYQSCASPASYPALNPGSHVFDVKATNSTGQESDPATFGWIVGSPNVLIAGAGDPGLTAPTDPNDNLVSWLSYVGYTVTESSTLPTDLSSFGQVWWVDTDPPTTDEQAQLINFAESGKGVFLTGDWSSADSGYSELDAADQSMVNSIVTGGGITLGGAGCCSDATTAYSVNSGVAGDLATQPHTLTSWSPTFPGLISGVAASSVLAYYPTDSTQVAAAAWDRPSTVGEARLVLFMDINWAETDYMSPQGSNFSDVVDNVALFLSGLSGPPIPYPAPISKVGDAPSGAPAVTALSTATSR